MTPRSEVNRFPIPSPVTVLHEIKTNFCCCYHLVENKIFIANILKCRPPNNRDPKTDEVDACRKYLKRQLELIKPKIILALGRIAAQNLLKSDMPIGKMRGNSYLYPNSNLPVVVTYHPAYLLRSPREKRKVWGDLKFAMQKYKELT